MTVWELQQLTGVSRNTIRVHLKKTGGIHSKDTRMDTAPNAVQSTAGQSMRLTSIDALRGFDMLWITGGAGVVCVIEHLINRDSSFFSKQFEHVDWGGMRFEDLIMPLFMFLAGVSLPFSTASRFAKNPSRWHFWGHALKRIGLLWIFGMAVQGNLLSWNPDKWVYYSNTLQAIAAGFLIASLFHLYASRRWQYAGAAALLLFSWAVYAWIPAPGGQAGDYAANGNIAIWLDRCLMGKHQDGTTYTWILSSLNFGVTTMLGMFAGYLLRRADWSGNRKALWLAGTGAGAIVLSLCWAPLHPVIKHLWTGSFTLLSGGMSVMLLALFYWVIDVKGFRRWSYFFAVIGSNAIAAYMLFNIAPIHQLSGRLFNGLDRWLSDGGKSLVHASGPLLVLWLILWFLRRHKIFLKV